MIDWAKFIERVELRYPMPMRMRFDPVRQVVIWSFYVSLHTTGEYCWIDTIPIPVPMTQDERVALHWVRYWTQVTVLHELDECFYLDGHRPYDPHRVIPLPRWDT